MLVRFETILILFAVAFSTSKGGSIDKEFLKSFSHDEDTKDTIVEFPEVIDKVLSHPDVGSLEGSERKNKIVELLREHTSSSQLPVINQIASLGLADKATPFWIANKISIKDASLKSLKALAASSPGEFTIRKAETVKILPIDTGVPVQEEQRVKRQTTTYQWGVLKIGANIAFKNNITGKGVILAVIDSGARVTHVALKDNYRGGPYSWLDAVNGNNTAPYDDNGHGSHCHGIATGTQNGIGVAPGAKWISCKALDADGRGSEAVLLVCAQWVACPNNSTGSCKDYPDVVSCSWGGGNDRTFFNSEIKSWIGLGIVPNFAIGNNGPACGTAISPGDQPNLISVGATEKDDTLSDFSSKGPGGPLLYRWLGIGSPTKPEVVAPGRDIVSVDYLSDTGYIAHSGTSMAAPHVAGASALIKSTDKSLRFEDVRDRLEKTAIQHTANYRCSIRSSSRPNDFYGYGRISVPKALNLPE